MEKVHRARYEERIQSFHALLKSTTLPTQKFCAKRGNGDQILINHGITLLMKKPYNTTDTLPEVENQRLHSTTHSSTRQLS